MTKARDTANIVGGGFSGTIAGATMEPTGDTAAGDNAAIGFTAAEGLILTGQGSTGDVTIKNDADADVIEIPTGTVNVTMAGTLGVTGVITGGGLVVPDGSIAVADLDIDGGTDIGAALVDADLMIVDDGAGGTNRKATMARLATYMGTKITGGSKVFIASSGAISSAATVDFTQFDSTAYDSYEFHFIDVLPATDASNLRLLTSSDTSSHSYDTGSADYLKRYDATATAAFAQPLAQSTIGGAANEGVSIVLMVVNPHTSAFTNITVVGGAFSLENGAHYQASEGRFGCKRLETAQVNAIRFKFDSGNIASGEIVMYGIANGT
jgi:hypothetical protein